MAGYRPCRDREKIVVVLPSVPTTLTLSVPMVAPYMWYQNTRVNVLPRLLSNRPDGVDSVATAPRLVLDTSKYA